jgi:hypothetical protein
LELKEVYREWNKVGYVYEPPLTEFLSMLVTLGLIPKRLVNYEILQDGKLRIIEFPIYNDFLDLSDLLRVWLIARGDVVYGSQSNKRTESSE